MRNPGIIFNKESRKAGKNKAREEDFVIITTLFFT
jgi:hypothetical protein